MSTQTNPYFRLRDKQLRKAKKHYTRAVEAHYAGIWLDRVNDMDKKMHEDIDYMHDEYKKVAKRARKHLKEVEKMLREIEKSIK